MAARAIFLSRQTTHGVRSAVLEKTFERNERLSAEQRSAIEHVAGASGSPRLSAVPAPARPR